MKNGTAIIAAASLLLAGTLETVAACTVGTLPLQTQGSQMVCM
jgi:hypothetical protein